MLISLLIFGFGVLFACLTFLAAFFIAVSSDRRKRQMQDEQTIHHLRATKFLQ